MYGGTEQKPLFDSSSPSSSTGAFERGPPSSSATFPGQESVQNVQTLQQQTKQAGCCSCLFQCKTNSVRRCLSVLGALNGVVIAMVGVATGLGWTYKCPEVGCAGAGTVDTSCCYCVWTDVILPCYTVFLGGILTLAELRLPFCHPRCKDGCGFMFSLTWRVLYLLFIGSFGFAIKCTDYKWVGYGAGVFTFLNCAFSCWMMNSHPGFLTLSGHEDFSATTERALNIRHTTSMIEDTRGSDMTYLRNSKSGEGSGGEGYAPPPNNNPFNTPDPYASSSSQQHSSSNEPVNPMFPEQSFDANPFA
jgi:hypothetical protein